MKPFESHVDSLEPRNRRWTVGLKGGLATWARESIDGVWPKRLERYFSSGPQLKQVFSICNKVVYAVSK